MTGRGGRCAGHDRSGYGGDRRAALARAPGEQPLRAVRGPSSARHAVAPTRAPKTKSSQTSDAFDRLAAATAISAQRTTRLRPRTPTAAMAPTAGERGATSSRTRSASTRQDRDHQQRSTPVEPTISKVVPLCGSAPVEPCCRATPPPGESRSRRSGPRERTSTGEQIGVVELAAAVAHHGQRRRRTAGLAAARPSAHSGRAGPPPRPTSTNAHHCSAGYGPVTSSRATVVLAVADRGEDLAEARRSPPGRRGREQRGGPREGRP